MHAVTVPYQRLYRASTAITGSYRTEESAGWAAPVARRCAKDRKGALSTQTKR